MPTLPIQEDRDMNNPEITERPANKINSNARFIKTYYRNAILPIN